MQRLRNRLLKISEPPDFSKIFKKARKAHVIKKGTIIFNEGDPLGRLYLILGGFVKLYRLSEDGKETTSYLLGPNYILGVRALLSEDETAFHNAEAITDLKVVTISREEYFKSVEENPEFLVDIAYVFIDRLKYTERKLEGFIYADTVSRVSNFLLDSAIRFGKKQKSHILIPLELTHQRISEFVGSFRETVTLALHRLENEKVIKYTHGEITILNLGKLKEFAFGHR